MPATGPQKESDRKQCGDWSSRQKRSQTSSAGRFVFAWRTIGTTISIRNADGAGGAAFPRLSRKKVRNFRPSGDYKRRTNRDLTDYKPGFNRWKPISNGALERGGASARGLRTGSRDRGTIRFNSSTTQTLPGILLPLFDLRCFGDPAVAATVNTVQEVERVGNSYAGKQFTPRRQPAGITTPTPSPCDAKFWQTLRQLWTARH